MPVFEFLSPGAQYWTGILAGFILIYCAWRAPWSKLVAVGVRQHLLLGSILALGIFWAVFSITIDQHFVFHPLLVTALSLVFGFYFAQLAGALALLLSALVGGLLLQNLAWHYLFGVLVAGLASAALAQLVQRSGIQNLFLFTLGCGFFGGMLSIVAVGLVNVGLYTWWQLPDYQILQNYFHVYLLLTFPEGFCNGAIVSSMAVMAPELVKAYDEDFYLRR